MALGEGLWKCPGSTGNVTKESGIQMGEGKKGGSGLDLQFAKPRIAIEIKVAIVRNTNGLKLGSRASRAMHMCSILIW